MAADIGSIVAHLKLEMREFTNNLNVAQQQIASTADRFSGITSAGEAFSKVGGAIVAGVGVPLMAVGASVVKTQMQFQDAMANVKALSGATGEEFKLLEDTAKKMGAETVFSASECADAMGYMALAGWDAQQSVEGLPGVLNLAASSGMGLAQASDLVTDYLSAFGESADQAGRMADVLAYAQANSNTTTEMLGLAFKNCAVNAHAFGLDIEQTTAVLGKLADQGLKGAEGGTALNAVFRDMSSKMEKGAIQIGKTKVAITDANGNFKSMAEIVKGVQKATDGLSDSEKMTAMQTTFTADSIKAMGILCNTGGDAINGFTEELYNSDGTAKEMADTMNNTLSGSIKELSSAWEGLQLNLGNTTGVLTGLIQKVTEVVRWFDGLSSGTKQMIIGVAGSVAVFGVFMLVIGKVLQGINTMRTTFGMLKAVIGLVKTGIMSGLSTAMTWIYVFVVDSVIPAFSALWGVLMANPIILIITAIVALVAGFIYLWNNCEGFREFWINLWDIICTAAQNAWNSIVEFFTVSMPQWFNSVIQWFQQLPGQIWYWLVFCVTYAALWVQQMVQKGIQAGRDFVVNAINFIQTLPSRVWNWLLMTIARIITWASNMKAKATQAGRTFVSNVVNFIQNLPSRVWNWLVNTVQRAVAFVSNFAKEATNAGKQFVDNIVNGVKGLPQEMLSIGGDICRGLANGIKNGISWVTDAAKNIARDAVSAAKNKLGIQSPSRVFANEVGKFIPSGISLGIESNAESVYKTLRNLSNNLSSNINVRGLIDSINIRTSDINVNSKNSNAGLITEIKGLIEAVKSNSTIDYDKMVRGFEKAVNKMDNTIVMDKTVVGKMTAKTVNEENKIADKQRSRFRGEVDYV